MKTTRVYSATIVALVLTCMVALCVSAHDDIGGVEISRIISPPGDIKYPFFSKIEFKNHHNFTVSVAFTLIQYLDQPGAGVIILQARETKIYSLEEFVSPYNFKLVVTKL